MSSTAEGEARSDNLLEKEPLRRSRIVAIGLFLLVVAVLAFHLLLQTWPVVESVTQVADTEAPEQGQTAPQEIAVLGVFHWTLSPDTALLVLVVVVGGLGGMLHAATSFAVHLGKNDFSLQWTWWYLTRILVGAGVAAVLYFAVRGGLMAVSGGTQDVNPFGFAAFAGLAGLFSTAALTKLGQVFETIVGKSVEDVTPTVLRVDLQNEDPRKVRILGDNFKDSSVVKLDGQLQTTTYVSRTQLTAELGKDVSEGKEIVVVNPGVSSNTHKLRTVDSPA